MWFTHVYRIYKQHTNHLQAFNMTSYSTSIHNPKKDRQGNSIHDVLGMPCSGRRLSRMNPSFCHGSQVLLRIPHDTHDTVSLYIICKMFPTVSVPPDQLDGVTPIVTPSFNPYRTFHAWGKTRGGLTSFSVGGGSPQGILKIRSC